MTELESSPIAGAAPPFTGQEMIPDVVRAWPATRAVFDRYGLHCCGGPYGPSETIAYFSRAHAVDLEKLLPELEKARSAGDNSPPREAPSDPAGSIYKRFFIAGILATLTAGAVWGAILLLEVGLSQSFGTITVHEVNAHGHAQIFGWVGLFVMGFAYQAFPRFKHGALKRPWLALATFPIAIAGLVLRTVAEALPPSMLLLSAGLVGSALELAALLIFAWIVFETLLEKSTRPSASDRFILAATVWFVLQGLYDPFLFWMTSTAAGAEELVARVATYQVPLRDMQIHGFAALMIFGVSLRFLPGMAGLARVPDRLADLLLAAFNIAIAGEIAGSLGRRLSDAAIFPLLLQGSVLLYTAAAGLLAWKFGILHRRAEPDRSVKFLRAAYAWLLFSLLMLAAFPLYLAASGQTFSHAYFGAARHAVTVGFISMMILGVSSKVVPTLNGVPAAVLPALWLPFFLINAGCAARVSFQILTDFTPAAFPLAGASGILEVAALAIWGTHLVRILMGSYRRAAEALPEGRPRVARPEHIVGWLTAVAPDTIEVFERMGFSAITNRLLRETVARTITIRQACALKGIDEGKLLDALNETLGKAQPACGHRAVPVQFVGNLRGE